MKKTYETKPISATVFAWRGTSNHSHDDVLEISSTANALGISVRTLGESIVLSGNNGNWVCLEGQYLVLRSDESYEVHDFASLHSRYTSADPFPEPEPITN